METFESSCSVTHGSTVLVALGDPMWDPVKVSGALTVQKAARVRAMGILAIPRGNESNTVTFTICAEAAGPAEAAEAALVWAAGLPKTMADVTIAFATVTLTLKNAACGVWSSGHEEMLGRHTLTITGGELIIPEEA